MCSDSTLSTLVSSGVERGKRGDEPESIPEDPTEDFEDRDDETSKLDGRVDLSWDVDDPSQSKTDVDDDGDVVGPCVVFEAELGTEEEVFGTPAAEGPIEEEILSSTGH